MIVVLITGANNGIGYYMASELIKDGYHVAGIDLSGDNFETLCEEQPERFCFFHCDVADRVDVDAAIHGVIERWGQIDILVNNACLAIFSPFLAKNLEETFREVQVNYFGYVNMIQAALPHLTESEFGIIHNVSSGVGITGFSGIYGYASTKGAIEALTRTLAIELIPLGISVTLMHPPLTRTKSAEPLGIPLQMMVDPAVVGQKLAGKIQSQKGVITTDFQSAAGLLMMCLFPTAMG